MIGVSATTGNVTEGQKLLSWEFSSGLEKKRKRKAKEITDLISINEDLDKEAGPRRFAYKDLVSATNRFSAQRKLREGWFGADYRGFLNEIDSLVAVKKLSGCSKQGK
uniref:Uncharacterized protein n=1 Tax=Brassica oleracea TaxID=3712 RepID=A0A3P6D1N4_BRAOL|nr:unnamed protein product [Brassica oleracea]